MFDHLEKELAQFRSRRAAWIQEGRTGQWCVIRGEELLGFFPDFDTAFAAGLQKFGTESFLVKQILASEPTERILHAFPL